MRKTIGRLDCIVREGENDGMNVVLLHGFGADAGDLAPLADYLNPDQQWNFYFPEAHLEVPIGPHMTGRAWFPISIREIEAGIDFTKIRPPGLSEAMHLVEDLIFELNSKKLILGGFSQGAMLTAAVSLKDPLSIAGMILFSGALLDEENWRRQAESLKGKPFFQSHGINDPVIPVGAAEKLNAVLKGAGAEGGFLKFAGGHEIPMAALQKAREFIAGLT